MNPAAAAAQLPEGLSRYLGDDSLAALWGAIRARLERNGLSSSGHVRVPLDDRGADRLAGLLGTPVRAGEVKIALAALDTALRRSSAAAGLVTVTAAVTGSTLVDRRATRAAQSASWARIWDSLDAGLVAAGLAHTTWASDFVEAVRRSGQLTRAGLSAATDAVAHSVTALGELAAYGPLIEPGSEIVESRWELAELAGRCTGDAHGLDDGRLAATLVLRAAAIALDQPMPATAAQRRELWARLGVTPDLVSGTVLVWGLRPPGPSRWAGMMRDRADLRVVTHLTLHELRNAAAGAALATTDQPVHACENPQILQAAARADRTGPVVCFAGNPASAGLLLLHRLIDAGAAVRYHGDFDWPGIAIANRLITIGATPWRMFATDYTEAVSALEQPAHLALTGAPIDTPWDEALSAHMRRTGIAVHEESLLPTLLADLVS